MLLVVTAALFAIGVSQERDGHSEGTESSSTTGEETTHEGESGESAEQREAVGAEDTHDEVAEGGGDEREILGVDPEAPGPVAVGVIVSLALAAGLWFTDKRGLAATAAAFAALFAVLDIAEVSHLLDEDNNSLAALAVAIAIGHAVAALSAARAALQPDTAVEV